MTFLNYSKAHFWVSFDYPTETVYCAIKGGKRFRPFGPIRIVVLCRFPHTNEANRFAGVPLLLTKI